MKKLSILLIMLLGAIGIKAAVSVTTANGYVVVTTTSEGEINNLTDAQKSLIKNATHLRLAGYYNSSDMQQFGNSDLCGPVTHLDLTDAHFATWEGTDWTTGSPVQVTKSCQTVKPWRTTLTHLITSQHETADFNRMDMFENFNSGLPALVELTINGSMSIPANCFQGLTSLNKLTFGPNVNRIGNDAFNACTGLEELDLGGVKVIGSNAFAKCSGLTEVTIPGTVTSIETKAFTDCDAIEKITFDELLDEDGNSLVNMTIATEVFTQADHIWNVYVNTLGTITCAPKAFDMSTTYAHGDASSQTAVLHYPKEKTSDYCNLNHVLDFATASNPAAFHVWLLEHFNRAQSGGTNNGWHEFVNSGTGEDEIPIPPGGEDKILKTFSFCGNVTNSDGTHCTVAKVVPEGVKAYIINKVEKNDDGNWQLTLKSIQAIPEFTGVILYGAPNSLLADGKKALSMTTVPYNDYPITRENWDRFYKPQLDENGKIVRVNGVTQYTDELDLEARNLLLPTCVDRNGVEVGAEKLQIEPYELNDSKTEVEFRNFVLGQFSKTDLVSSYVSTYGSYQDFYAYYRVKSGKISAGKSYLHLHRTEYRDAKGAEAIIQMDLNYKKEINANGEEIEGPAWANRKWTDLPVYDWGKRNLSTSFSSAKYTGEPIFEDILEGVATIIIPVNNTTEENNDIYTLQGVKVSNPTTPGIYVKNGKKFVIK